MVHLSSCKLHRLVLVAIFATLKSQACCAFLTHPSNAPLSLSFSLYAKETIDHDEDSTQPTESATLSATDTSRRKVLSILQAAPLLAYQSAFAQVEVLDSPPQVSTSQKTASRTMCADLEEENRIAIFERVAPSVVYIDTFAEKRDVFSTNM